MPRGRPKKIKDAVAAVEPAKKKKSEAIVAPPTVVATANPASRFGSGYGFDYLAESSAITSDVQKIVHGISARRKNRTTNFKAMSDVRKNMVYMPDLPLQYLFGNYGVPERSLIEIIGGEGVGKSTLCHYIEGQFLKQGCPVYHQECEGKPIDPQRIRRIVSEDQETGKKIVSAIHFDSARSLKESFEKFVDWIKIMRGKEDGKKVSIPMHVPLLVVVDPWGKLMSKNEAAGFYDYGALKEEKAKDMLEVSNMGHSQGAHRWVRRLPFIMDTFNVTIILVQHQNQKVDMSGMGGSFQIPEEHKKLNNTTKTGGEAFNQLDALQFVIARKGALKNSKGENIGSTMKVKVSKNSYGPEGRIIEYDLISDGFQDTGGKLERAVRFDRWFSEFCAGKSYMGTSVKSKRYSCAKLGVEGARTDEFYNAFISNAEAVDQFGASHGINGYDTAASLFADKLDAMDHPTEPEETPPEEAQDDSTEEEEYNWSEE